jgi:hypothetical protein
MEEIMFKTRTSHCGRSRVLTVAVVLTTVLASAASGQTSGTRPVLTQEGRTFLTPLPSRFVIQPGEPGYPREVCRGLSNARCPAVLAFGGTGGGLPTIDPAFTAHVPNVRVSFALHQIVNEVVEDPGAGVHEGLFLFVKTHGSAASVERYAWEFNLTTPPNGTTNFEKPPLIYDALVFGVCESLASFPIDHEANIGPGNGTYIGSFYGVDDSTLSSTGFYTFNYSIPAQSTVAGASLYHLSGTVSVTCSGLDALP